MFFYGRPQKERQGGMLALSSARTEHTSLDNEGQRMIWVLATEIIMAVYGADGLPNASFHVGGGATR